MFSVTDPLQQSDVWMEEDFDSLAQKFSDKNECRVYTRNLANPLGQNLGSRRKGRSGSENLGDFYPNRSSAIHKHTAELMCICVHWVPDNKYSR